MDEGIFYFSSEAGMSGKVLSGIHKAVVHLGDHHLGTPGDPNDLESWVETFTGLKFGIKVPGHGMVFQDAGHEVGKVTVIAQVPGPYDPIEYDWRNAVFHGIKWRKTQEICAYFGFDVVT